MCDDGVIVSYSVEQIRRAIQERLVPVVYGDVAIDMVRGGTIISTEEILAHLVPEFGPSSLLLAGETNGVLDEEGKVIPEINRLNFEDLRASIGASRGTDVTGGMASKVEAMLDLVNAYPDLKIKIFSGLLVGALQECLLNPEAKIGTEISSV